jgi:hypothetical protein
MMCREQLWFAVGRMAKLIAALANLRVLAEHAMHRPHRTDVAAFVQERREHFGRRKVDQSRLVQRIEQSLTLGVAEAARRRSSLGLRAVDRRAMPAVRRAVDAQCGASRDDAEIRYKTEGGHHSLSSSIGGSAIPSTCESFFWTSMIASARSPTRELRDQTLLLGELLVARVDDLRLRATLLRGQARDLAALGLLAPLHQVRRVQALPT